jgi:hypothetical protein
MALWQTLALAAIGVLVAGLWYRTASDREAAASRRAVNNEFGRMLRGSLGDLAEQRSEPRDELHVDAEWRELVRSQLHDLHEAYRRSLKKSAEHDEWMRGE